MLSSAVWSNIATTKHLSPAMAIEKPNRSAEGPQADVGGMQLLQQARPTNLIQT